MERFRQHRTLVHHIEHVPAVFCQHLVGSQRFFKRFIAGTRHNKVCRELRLIEVQLPASRADKQDDYRKEIQFARTSKKKERGSATAALSRTGTAKPFVHLSAS